MSGAALAAVDGGGRNALHYACYSQDVQVWILNFILIFYRAIDLLFPSSPFPFPFLFKFI